MKVRRMKVRRMKVRPRLRRMDCFPQSTRRACMPWREWRLPPSSMPWLILQGNDPIRNVSVGRPRMRKVGPSPVPQVAPLTGSCDRRRDGRRAIRSPASVLSERRVVMTVRHLPGAPPGQRRCIADPAPGRTVCLVAVARDRTQTRSAAARGQASAVGPALSRGPPGRLRPGPSGHLWRIPAWTLSRPGRGRAERRGRSERRAPGQPWTGATSAARRATSNASSCARCSSACARRSSITGVPVAA